MCTGREAFLGPTTMALLTAFVVDKLKPIRELNPNIPAAFAEFVMKLLAKKPAQRPGFAAEALELLSRTQSQYGKPTKTTERLPLDSALSRRRTRPKKNRKEPQRSRRTPLRMWFAVAGCVLLAGCAAIVWKLNSGSTPILAAATNAPAISFLTEMKPVRAENWPSILPPGADRSRPGSIIRLGGALSTHEVFLHPAPPHLGSASLSYRIEPKHMVFSAKVGINDGPARSQIDCTFWVHGDGREIFKSRPIRNPGDVQEIEADISNVEQITIAVTCDGPPMGAHTVWFELRMEQSVSRITASDRNNVLNPRILSFMTRKR